MIVFVTILLLSSSLVSGLQESDVSEKNLHETIFKLKNDPIDLDLKWMSSVNKWYVPMWGKLHSYRAVQGMLEKEDISETDLSTSCLLFYKDGSIDAFGKTFDFEIKSDAESIGFTTPWKKIKSKFSFRLTDNKKYIFGISSWVDGQISWAVISTEPDLKPDARKSIMEYIKSVGLDESLTVRNVYDGCKEVANKSKTNNEL